MKPSLGAPSATTTLRRMLRLKFSTFVCLGLVLILGWSVCVLILHTNDLPSSEKDTWGSGLLGLAASSTAGSSSRLQADLLQARRRVLELEQQVQQIKQRQNFQQKVQTNTQGQTTARLQQGFANCEQQQRNAQEDDFSSGNIQQQLQSKSLSSRNPVCRALPQPISTAAALWTKYFSDIHKASQVPNDIKYYFHDFTAQLLHLVSPRLSYSVKTLPHDWRQVANILQVAYERYQYIKNPQSYAGREPPRPLKIVIMGGSLLVGMNCRKLVHQMGMQLRLPLQDCSWANRLEKVINQFLLGEILSMGRKNQLDTHYIVQVSKIAMGGTNTVRLLN
jgi:hypothetical protein